MNLISTGLLLDAGANLSLLANNTSITTLDTTGTNAVDVAAQVDALSLLANNIWMMISTALVFIMHLGFAGVEAGFTQAKNTVNILYKNTLTPAIGLITYAIFGFNLMYPGFETPGWFAFAGFGLPAPMVDGSLDLSYNAGYTYWTDFLFQGMFAATAATIVSGAVAERIKISGYFIFTVFFVGLVYPIIGSWKWGGGALDDYGFYDFAGSTLVHSVGGWGALAGVIILGPRIGKYVDGKINDFPGSSVPLAVIGVFLLWLGWFGFNGGSVLSADPAAVSLVLVTTSLAAATGAIGGSIMGYIVFKRLDLGMSLNGILAGLVGITAGADQMSYIDALVIGLISGMLVVVAAVGMDKLKLDDCVGAVSVHLVCGIFGTLAVGIFGKMASMDQFIIQLVGVLTCGAAAFISALVIFFVVDKTMGLRVTAEHEKEGLDSHEHGIRGYTIIFDE
ncbi:ammonium transporter [Chondrinema litorale]|uniref:ammonium transporter n=1 Tax=Chondrinema litorale TaxID=2994555 RepID=UPI0025438A02|nr:ammonium transporter [Chondrinema litorale]UZR94175.1 ammonium transporter [Chondrinema litorale]